MQITEQNARQSMLGTIRAGQINAELMDCRSTIRALRDESASYMRQSISYRDRAAEQESQLSRISLISSSAQMVALAMLVDAKAADTMIRAAALSAELLELRGAAGDGDVEIPFRAQATA